jgi:hypothetical protein
MADHELIRETMVSLGEGMQDCGYDAVLETVEGNGLVGRAVSNPRDSQQLRVIILYLKDLAQTVRAEAPNPGREVALQMLQEAWATIRAAVHEEDEDAEEDIAYRKQRDAQARAQHQAKLMQGQGRPPQQKPQQRQLQAPARPGQKVVVAPAPAKRPALSGSSGHHYFRG